VVSGSLRYFLVVTFVTGERLNGSVENAYFKLQNAPNCTDLNLYLHKLPGGNIPDPKTGEGISPLSLGASVHRQTYPELPRPLPPIRSPNMQRDFIPTPAIFLVLLFLSASFQSALKHTQNRTELRPKPRKSVCGWGSAPDPAGRAYDAPQTT